MKKRVVKVGMIKAEAVWADPRGNMRLLDTLALPLAGEKLDFLVTPECFVDGYMVREEKKCTRKKLKECSVTGPRHPLMKRASGLAAKLKCNLVIGASERDRCGAIRNAAYIFDRRGKHVGTYYKIQAGQLYEPGHELSVFRTDVAIVGIVICADRRWPENIRCLRLEGAEIILNPTWGVSGDLNTAIMRTRAHENDVPICFAHPRQSLICSADGNVDAFLESNQPGVLVHEVTLAETRIGRTKDRSSSRPIQNRRPELYNKLVEKA